MGANGRRRYGSKKIMDRGKTHSPFPCHTLSLLAWLLIHPLLELLLQRVRIKVRFWVRARVRVRFRIRFRVGDRDRVRVRVTVEERIRLSLRTLYPSVHWLTNPACWDYC